MLCMFLRKVVKGSMFLNYLSELLPENYLYVQILHFVINEIRKLNQDIVCRLQTTFLWAFISKLNALCSGHSLDHSF